MRIARSVRSRGWQLAAIAAAIGLVTLVTPITEAHKAITSPYNYTDHVFPIVRDRCGRCHFEGGPTPMSLLTYMDALPWAESMREQLVGEHMPAWYADPTGPLVKGGHTISSRELDVIVTWATGGTPQGELGKKPPVVPPPTPWRSLGKPDQIVEMAEEYTVPASTMEERREFTLATGLTETRWVKAVDLLPGAPSMVREATVQVENGPLLAAWVPGHDAIAAPNGSAFQLSAGAKVKLSIRYRKHYLDEQNAVKDRTSIGLYFTDEPVSGKSIESFAIDGKVGDEGGNDTQTFSGTLATAARVLAFRPLVDQTYSTIDVHAVLANGRKVPLLLLRAQRPEWPRRYWLVEPIELPKGAKVEAMATPAPVNPDDVPSPRRDKLQIALDYVPQ